MADSPLSTDDEIMLTAYRLMNVPLDKLPYSPELDKIARMTMPARPLDDDMRWNTWQRLLVLQRRGHIKEAP